MQENFIGSNRELVSARADSDDVRYLYQPLIPPIPAFFIAISALTTLRAKITIIETTNDIGNGKTRDTIKTVIIETKNQATYFLPKGLSLALLIDTFWPPYYLIN
jgi:hypothetical protein